MAEPLAEVDLRIEDEGWRTIAGLEALCRRALAAAGRVSDTTGEVAILLTGDAQMQALNARWRSKDQPTDVLSFPADPMDAPFLGDIALGFEIANRDAETGGKSLPDHLTHLLIHGYLHLVGHDHMEDTEAEEMEALERTALASLGLPDPYSR